MQRFSHNPESKFYTDHYWILTNRHLGGDSIICCVFVDREPYATLPYDVKGRSRSNFLAKN